VGLKKRLMDLGIIGFKDLSDLVCFFQVSDLVFATEIVFRFYFLLPNSKIL